MSLGIEYRPLLNDNIEFKGGVAGLIGYEAMMWLESIDAASANDLPTPAISLGLYDWTIAVDHQQNNAWIVSQGLGGRNSDERRQLARQRLEQVQADLF